MVRLLVLYLAATTLALPMFGTAITPNGSYHEFAFGLAGSPVGTCATQFCDPAINPVAEGKSVPPWTFTSNVPVTLFVLDLFDKGDLFQFFDNLVSVGSTSGVPNTGVDSCGGDIGCAISDAGYSRLSVVLTPGSHSLTANLIRNAGGDAVGAAVFSVQAVDNPEPSTFGFMSGTGVFVLLGLIARTYRKRSRILS